MPSDPPKNRSKSRKINYYPVLEFIKNNIELFSSDLDYLYDNKNTITSEHLNSIREFICYGFNYSYIESKWHFNP